ncbi:cadherin domain-containing protein [Verrucomicrobiaceae bacterium N1E253]|uniref:Cadherin domain-containing protein n=1 Tax=Oceaniferula marina TaxID=2748318 RepID=A0A851GBZ3_9BACT|nr:cadherin domain-containing protein [Oceaniferula marina]NWK54946.1 cadherin domain-containing protein [Oceaniferula marina]
MKNTILKFSKRMKLAHLQRMVVGSFAIFGAVAAQVNAATPLPDDLKLVIDVQDSGTSTTYQQTLHLHKRSVRAPGFVLYTWDATNGYVAQPTPEVRTFKGTIGENSNALVFASINADNQLKASCIDMEWGHGRRWSVSGLDVSAQLGSPQTADPMPSQPVAAPSNGSAGTPTVGPKVPTGTSAGGVPYGGIVEAELGMDCPVAAYTRNGQNLDNVLAHYEVDLMLWELMMARDLMVRVVVPTIVIRTENFYSSDPGNTSLGELKAAWLDTNAPLVSRGWDNVWSSEGYYAWSGVGQDESSVSAGALYHEIAHNWTAYHLGYMADTMGGNKPVIGPRTADTMLNKRQEAIDENKLPAGTYTDPLPPHTYVDVALTSINTAIDIDVLANDHDANGDSISVVSHTTTTVPGGSVTLNGDGTLHYVPPTGYVGKDMIVYTVQDDSPMSLKTRDVVHIEVVNNGLMVHYDMEDATGTLASDVSGVGIAGDLNGADFATDSVVSPLGKGIRADGTQSENHTENGDWSGILMGSGNVMPITLNPSREASPFEQEYNQHSAFYDIMDGNYTFATWFCAESFDNADYPQGGGYGAYIAARRWHPETKVGWDLYAQNNTVGMHWHVFDGTKTIEHLSASYPLTEGKWYHIAAVFDRATDEIRILVNGQIVATRTNAFAGTNGVIFNGRAPLALGEFSNRKMCFDDVRIYSKALTTAETQALVDLADSGKARFIESTVQHSSYVDTFFNQSLVPNIWSEGYGPLSYEILSGPAWLTVDSTGSLLGTPESGDSGLNTFTIQMTDKNGSTDTVTLEINVPTVSTVNRIAHWKLDDGSGTTATDETGNYDGTLSGPTWTAGKDGGALSFNGVSDQVTCGVIPATSQMTFAGWINPASTSGIQAIFGKPGSFSISLNGSALRYTKPGVADYGSSGLSLAAGVWQHIAVTINGSELRFYKDGVLLSQSSCSYPNNNGNNVLLGNNQYSQFYGGLFDDMQMFDVALSPDEVGALHASYSAGTPASAHWKLDEGSGATATDEMGSYDGTISGATWTTGKDGGALSFNGTSDQVTCASVPSSSQMTFMGWIKPDDTSGNQALFGKSQSFSIRMSGSELEYTKPGVGDYKSSGVGLISGEWQHVAISINQSELSFYKNGVLVYQRTCSSPNENTNSVLLGNNQYNQRFGGLLDDLRIYDIVLHPFQIQSIYNGYEDPMINEAPTANDTNGSVAENAGVGAAVATVTATDPNVGDTLSYAITAGNGGGEFAINSGTGEITTTTALNYETMASYSLTVTVTDDGAPVLSDTATVTVNVTNVNEAPTAMDSVGSIAENSSAGAAIATVTASDPDAGDSLAYAITAGNSGGFFAIDSNGNVTTTGPLNYEAGSQYVLGVTVVDGGGLNDTATVTVNVTNVNEAPTASDVVGNVDENGSAGAAVATVLASDPDAGASLSYVIVSGNDSGLFAIDSAGNITTTAALDFEDLSQYLLTVTVSDGALDDTAQVTINVNDVNEDPEFTVDTIDLVDALDSTAYTGQTLAGSATDVDQGTSFSFSKVSGPAWLLLAADGALSGTPSSSDLGANVFVVEVSDGNGGTDTATLNIEVLDKRLTTSFANYWSSYAWSRVVDGDVNTFAWTHGSAQVDDHFTIEYGVPVGPGVFQILTGDPGNGGDSLAAGVMETSNDGINWTNVATFSSGNAQTTLVSPVKFVRLRCTASQGQWLKIREFVPPTNAAPVANDVTFGIAENATVGSAVGTVVATDADAGDTLTYAITGGNEAGAFAIDSSGNITTAASLDYETTAQYVLTITVTDDGTPVLNDTAVVTVDVSNVNEAPTLDDNSGSIAEDAMIGSAVVTVSASDPDVGDTLSYAISSGNTGNAFTIDSSGNITTATVLDFETTPSYVLTVTVTDNGLLADTAAVTVTVTDVVELTSPVIVTGAASNINQTTVDLAYSISDTGGEDPSVTIYYGEVNGGTVPANWTSSAAQGVKTTGSYLTSLSGLTENITYYFTVHASNTAGESWGSTGSFTTTADTSPKLVRTTVSAVSNSSWTTVNLGQNYTSAVIIATPIYPNTTTPPVVTRITNVSGGSFDLKVDRADGLTDAMTIDVSVIAVEEGVYTQATDGVTMEAVKYTSTVTSENNSWVGEAQTYQNSYTSPVVVGQVMSANDANWSVFWSMGSSRTAPADASTLNVGKHVGEDPNTTRANETIAYIVIESGSGTINGVAYEAALGADSVRGFGNSSSPYTYNLSGGLSTVSAAAASISGMDGGNGAWAVLSGSPSLTTTSIGLHALEDQLNDAEQSHTTTQVGYVVFE